MFVIKNKHTGYTKFTNDYPGEDISKMPHGFESDKFDLYVLIDEKPDHSELQQLIETGTIYTEKYHHELSHLKICYRQYDVIDIDKNKIINQLNTAFGDYIDNQYPVWKRLKHNDELDSLQRSLFDRAKSSIISIFSSNETYLLEEEKKRRDYINNMNLWLQRCRDERDFREKELIENNKYPDMINWEAVPII
jgi:hypothetical protein